MTQDELREKIEGIVDEYTTMVVGKIFEMVIGFELEESLKPDINSTTDTILSLIQQAEVKGKREVLQELLDWHEFYDSQKYTPPRREFDWQAAIENMLLQKDYPHGPIVRLAELENKE